MKFSRLRDIPGARKDGDRLESKSPMSQLGSGSSHCAILPQIPEFLLDIDVNSKEIDWGFPGGSVIESTRNAGDGGSIPGSGRCLGKGKWQPTPVHLACRIPWTWEPGGLQSMGPLKSQTQLRF